MIILGGRRMKDNHSRDFSWGLAKNSLGCNPGLDGRRRPLAGKRCWDCPSSWTGHPAEEQAHPPALGALSQWRQAAPPARRAVLRLLTRNPDLLVCPLKWRSGLLWKPKISTYSEKGYMSCKIHIKSLPKHKSYFNGFFYNCCIFPGITRTFCPNFWGKNKDAHYTWVVPEIPCICSCVL